MLGGMTRRRQRRNPFPDLAQVGRRLVGGPAAAASSTLGDGVVVPTAEEIQAALDAIPADLSWEWAAPRLIPVFERGYVDGTPGDPLINTLAPIGVGIGFAIDMGPVLARVSRSLALRWEASVEQIERAAFAHLAEVARTITPRDVQPFVYRGHMVRGLGEPGGWSSSLVLDGADTLSRIFGPQDQVFTVPSRNNLLAFDAATPSHAIVDVTLAFEGLDPNPLELDPFTLVDGILAWDGLSDPVPEP